MVLVLGLNMMHLPDFRPTLLYSDVIDSTLWLLKFYIAQGQRHKRRNEKNKETTSKDNSLNGVLSVFKFTRLQ